MTSESALTARDAEVICATRDLLWAATNISELSIEEHAEERGKVISALGAMTSAARLLLTDLSDRTEALSLEEGR